MENNRNWNEILDTHYSTLPVLMVTTDLRNRKLNEGMWGELIEMYAKVNEDRRVEARVMASIINAILTQNRFYFCMTREKTRELIQNDLNHECSDGFDNGSWRRILSFLTKQIRLISCEREGKGLEPTIYFVEATWVREKLLCDNPEEQSAQCLEFVTRTGAFERQTNKK